MNAGERGSMHFDLTQRIIGVFYEVYNELGPGFLESVYERAMVVALHEQGLVVESQAPVRVLFRGPEVGDFRVDLLIGGVVIVELKTARSIDAAHEGQLLNYLKATHVEVGLILNFEPKPEFKRLVFSNARKRSPRSAPIREDLR